MRKLHGRFPAAAEKQARFAPHGAVVDVARMLLQIFRVDRHAVSADVSGTCRREIDVSSPAHVDETRDLRFARERRDLAEAFFEFRLLEAREDLNPNAGMCILKFREERRQPSRGKARR